MIYDRRNIADCGHLVAVRKTILNSRYLTYAAVQGDNAYSGLMPANFTARAQLGQSLRTNFWNSSTDIGCGSEP